MEDENVPRFKSDFEKVCKKWKKLKCECKEGERLVKEYDIAKKTFDKVKEDFEQHKLAQTFNFTNLGDLSNRLMFITLDFESDELSLRQELWHQRITLLLSNISNQDSKPATRLNCEQVRYWLEEGQELEVVNDSKYERLNDLVEDLDNIARALRMCVTVQEVDQIDKQENHGLIELDHLVKAAKLRISRGEQAPKRTQQTLTPLDYLKNLRGKLNNSDEDRRKKKAGVSKKDNDDEDASMNPSDAEDEDDDTDLEEEKPEEGEGGDTNKKKKSGGAKKKENTSSEVKKPVIMGSKLGGKSAVSKPIMKKREKKEEYKETEKKAAPAIKKKTFSKPAAASDSKESEEKKDSEECVAKPAIKGLSGGPSKLIKKSPTLGGALKKKFESPQKEEA